MGSFPETSTDPSSSTCFKQFFAPFIVLFWNIDIKDQVMKATPGLVDCDF